MMNAQQEREVLEFLEDLANWNVPYSARKYKGQHQRQIAAQKLLAALYFDAGYHEYRSTKALLNTQT